MLTRFLHCILLFFFNDTATTEIYTLSLHDALPICVTARRRRGGDGAVGKPVLHAGADRKSTRLNSSHGSISYAAFFLKQKILEIDFGTFRFASCITFSFRFLFDSN